MHIPNLVGVVGQFGAGKSLKMVEVGLAIANRYKKPLIANFPLNEKACRDYCRSMGFHWFAACGRVKNFELDVSNANSLMKLFDFRRSVVLFDEAGIFANSRRWDKLPPTFAQKLFQIRSLNIHMLLAFQFVDQIDKNFRETIQYWIWCKGLTVYDARLQAPRLHLRFAYYYKLEQFQMLCEDPELRSKALTPWRMAQRVEYSIPPLNDFLAELHNFKKLIKFYSSGIPFRPFAGAETMLFRCFASISVLGDKPLSYRRFHKPIFVSNPPSYPS